MAAEGVCLAAVLGACACEDVLYRRMHVIVIIGGALMGIFLHLMYHRLGIMDVFGGFSIGLLLWLVSLFSHGRIGGGDAMLLMTTGIYLGFLRNLELLWISSALTGMLAVAAAFVIRRRGKNTASVRIPFAPSVLAAFCIYLFLCRGRMA